MDQFVALEEIHIMLCFFNHFTPVTPVGDSHRYISYELGLELGLVSSFVMNTNDVGCPLEEGTTTRKLFNPFTTGNLFLGTKLLGCSIGRGSGALKGLSQELCRAKTQQ